MGFGMDIGIDRGTASVLIYVKEKAWFYRSLRWLPSTPKPAAGGWRKRQPDVGAYTRIVERPTAS